VFCAALRTDREWFRASLAQSVPTPIQGAQTEAASPILQLVTPPTFSPPRKDSCLHTEVLYAAPWPTKVGHPGGDPLNGSEKYR